MAARVEVRVRSAEEVLAHRREKSAPLIDKLRQWLDGTEATNVLPKSRLGEAVRYLRNQWDALTVFLRVEFDRCPGRGEPLQCEPFDQEPLSAPRTSFDRVAARDTS